MIRYFLLVILMLKELETCLSDFLYENDLKCIVKENTCSQS